jgi:Tfp pilus assembly major pilin PilA
LITLGIIGVVAAITLPTLIQNYQKKTYVEGLKSGISILSQGFRKILADEGVDDLANTEMWKNCNTETFDTSSDSRKACEATLSKYFKVVKFQSQSDLTALGDTTSDYFGYTPTCKNVVGKTNKRWYLNDKTRCYGRTLGITVTLSNGMKAYLYLDSSSSFKIGYVHLDINGEKGPNTWGRDTFVLYILTNGNVVGSYDRQYAKAQSEYYPETIYTGEWYKNYSETNCSSTTTTQGLVCSGRIINDGWKMNY